MKGPGPTFCVKVLEEESEFVVFMSLAYAIPIGIFVVVYVLIGGIMVSIIYEDFNKNPPKFESPNNQTKLKSGIEATLLGIVWLPAVITSLIRDGVEKITGSKKLTSLYKTEPNLSKYEKKRKAQEISIILEDD